MCNENVNPIPILYIVCYAYHKSFHVAVIVVVLFSQIQNYILSRASEAGSPTNRSGSDKTWGQGTNRRQG